MYHVTESTASTLACHSRGASKTVNSNRQENSPRHSPGCGSMNAWTNCPRLLLNVRDLTGGRAWPKTVCPRLLAQLHILVLSSEPGCLPAWLRSCWVAGWLRRAGWLRKHCGLQTCGQTPCRVLRITGPPKSSCWHCTEKYFHGQKGHTVCTQLSFYLLVQLMSEQSEFSNWEKPWLYCLNCCTIHN